MNSEHPPATRIAVDMTFSDGGDRIITRVDEKYDGRLIKDFLKGRVGLSTTLLSKVKYGGVRVCGEVVTMRKIVHTDDDVEICLPKENSENIEPIDGKLDVLYEDDHILVVNKPTNMPVHPSRGNHLVTLGNVVMAYLGDGVVFRAVNRLDRDTSGIVVIAKHQYAAGRLSEDMKHGRFEKYYTALLECAPESLSGIIDAPIEREAEDSIKRVVRDDGKRAVTEYSIREVLPDGRAICDVRLHTGRTHQIRVHMAHIGAPLYADFLYGKRIEGESYSLVSSRIVFNHPITGEKMDIRIK